MKGPKPVCTLATNKTNQSKPRRLLGLGGGMRSVGFLPSPPVGGANSSAGARSAGLRSGPPAARRGERELTQVRCLERCLDYCRPDTPAAAHLVAASLDLSSRLNELSLIT